MQHLYIHTLYILNFPTSCQRLSVSTCNGNTPRPKHCHSILLPSHLVLMQLQCYKSHKTTIMRQPCMWVLQPLIFFFPAQKYNNGIGNVTIWSCWIQLVMRDCTKRWLSSICGFIFLVTQHQAFSNMINNSAPWIFPLNQNYCHRHFHSCE